MKEWMRTACVAVGVLCSGVGWGQSPVPVVLKVTTDKKAELTKGAYVLAPDETYRFEVSVATEPEVEINAALKKLKARFQVVRDTLVNPSPYRDNLLTWLDDSVTVSQAIGEFTKLTNALGAADPLDNLGTVRSSLLRPDALRLFLLESYQDGVTLQMKDGCGQAKTLERNGGSGLYVLDEITTSSCSANDLVLTVTVPDAAEEIQLRYYNEMLRTAGPFVGYSTERLNEMYRELLSWQQTYTNYAKRIKSPEGVMWADSLREEISTLTNEKYSEEISQNLFMDNQISDASSLGSWIIRTSWLSDGKGRVNPLPFTDRRHLPRMPDTATQVMSYEDYREGLLQDLRNATELTDGRMNYRLIDTFLNGYDREEISKQWRLRGDSLVKANATVRRQFIDTRASIQQLTFVVPALLPKRRHVLLIKGPTLPAFTGNVLPMGLSTRDSLYFVVTNVPADLTLKATPTASSIEDRSAATSAIMQVGEIAGRTLANASPLGIVVSNLVNVLGRQVREVSPKKVLPSSRQDNTQRIVREKFVDDASLSENMKIRINEVLPGGRFNQILTRSLFENIEQSLTVDGQEELVAAYNQKVSVQDYQDPLKRENQIDIDALIAKAYEEAVLLVQTELTKEFHHQRAIIDAAVALFAEPISRLPPPGPLASITTGDATAAPPAFRNVFAYQRNDGKAQQHDLTLELFDAKGKPRAGRRYRYKTSPGHRISGSIGPSLTFGKVKVTEASEKDGKVTTETVERLWGAAGGLHVHFGPMVNTNDGFFFSSKLDRAARLSRVSAFFGTNLRKLLYYPQIGVAVDAWPGVKLVGGLQFSRRNYYEVLNDVILRDDYTYEPRVFVTLGLDPLGLAALLNLFN